MLITEGGSQKKRVYQHLLSRFGSFMSILSTRSWCRCSVVRDTRKRLVFLHKLFMSPFLFIYCPLNEPLTQNCFLLHSTHSVQMQVVRVQWFMSVVFIFILWHDYTVHYKRKETKFQPWALLLKSNHRWHLSPSWLCRRLLWALFILIGSLRAHKRANRIRSRPLCCCAFPCLPRDVSLPVARSLEEKSVLYIWYVVMNSEESTSDSPSKHAAKKID